MRRECLETDAGRKPARDCIPEDLPANLHEAPCDNNGAALFDLAIASNNSGGSISLTGLRPITLKTSASGLRRIRSAYPSVHPAFRASKPLPEPASKAYFLVAQ